MNRTVSAWLVAIVFLGLIIAIAGGGLMGGVVGYYVALNHATVSAPAAVPQLAAAQMPTQSSTQSPSQPPSVTNMTVTEDSAVIDTVKKTEPAVVTIVTTLQSRRRFGSTPNVAEGSGIIIDQQGHIVTNAHVVDGATQLSVIYSDGTEANATLVGEDTNNDVAVLQVSGKVPASISFGDSSALQLGQTVIAIGSPLGTYEGSVTVGVVSGLNRTVQGSGLDGLIQTDAAINHGNSGGPLLDLSGHVIGINTLVVQQTDSGDLAQRLGFAIPSNTVSSIVQKIISQGKP